ncbi:GspE/PulE family protein [Patescibacteria group bacterium]
MINEQKLGEQLVADGLLTAEQIETLQAEAQQGNVGLSRLVADKKLFSQETLDQEIAKTFGVQAVDLNQLKKIPKDVLLIIPEPLVKKHKVIAFAKTEDELDIAMIDPTDLEIIEGLKKKTGLQIVPYYANEKSVDDIIKLYRQSVKSKFAEILENAQAARTDMTSEEAAQDLPIIRIVDTLVDYAVIQDASDIHIEPAEKEVIVRYRIDGILHDILNLPKAVQPGIIARIKVLSDLKIDEHRLPQDGRFKRETPDYKVSFRVSILPIFDGEKIVLRILHEEQKVLTLEQLGLQHSALEIIKRNIERPNGMILATGPTGSGKTTTLYAILHILNRPEVNIATVEDPIEYRMPRVNQTQIKAAIGLTFSKGLRSLLRQDPDVLMVGEIRDNETAEIAVHAALTGHIVLSTLHTNNAAGSLPRLLDMKIKPFLAASTVNTVIGQRLVRRICPNCIESFSADKKYLSKIERDFDIARILEIMKREKIIPAKGTLSDLKFYRGRGCSQCNNEGHKGRIGIYEVLEITPGIQDLIAQQAATERIFNQAVKDGMITMEEDGFIKATTGITTLEEVLRVTKE